MKLSMRLCGVSMLVLCLCAGRPSARAAEGENYFIWNWGAPSDIDGKKAGGPAIAIDADVRKKDTKLDPRQLAGTTALIQSGWYEQSRRKIANAIMELQKSTE